MIKDSVGQKWWAEQLATFRDKITIPEDTCELSHCDEVATQVVNCGCHPESHGWTYHVCPECLGWMNGRITCPFHGDMN